MADQELNLLDPQCPILKFAALPATALSMFRLLASGELVAQSVPPTSIGSLDRTLLASAIEESGQKDVLVLSDDDAVVTWVMDEAQERGDQQGQVLSKQSIEFFGEMHSCGAISLEDLTTIVATEESYVMDRLEEGSIGAAHSDQKLERLRRVIDRAVFNESKREPYGS